MGGSARAFGARATALLILHIGCSRTGLEVNAARTTGAGAVGGSSVTPITTGCFSGGTGGSHPCTDTATDPYNCGTCGHSCLGGACAQGLCQPFVLANAPGALGIAMNGTTIFWTAMGPGVSLVSKGGGPPEHIQATGGAWGWGIAADDTGAYWVQAQYPTDADPVQLVRALTPIDLKVLATVGWANGGTGIALDAANIYFAGKDGIQSIPRTGGASTLLVPGWFLVPMLAVDDEYLYYGANPYSGAASIGKVPKAGGEPVQIAPATRAYALAVNANAVYWFEAGLVTGTPPPGSSYLARAPLSGGPVVHLAAASDVGGMTLDDSWVYWLDGAVKRVPLAGGPVEVLAEGYGTSMVNDCVALYWTQCSEWPNGPGAIMALAK